MQFNKEILQIDCENEIRRICSFIKNHIIEMKRDGIVIGLSGGIDSALVSELCVKALGKDKVFGLILPEKDSNPISTEYGKKQAKKLGIRFEMVDITSALEGFGTYKKRDKVIKSIFPEYTKEYKLKITLPANL